MRIKAKTHISNRVDQKCKQVLLTDVKLLLDLLSFKIEAECNFNFPYTEEAVPGYEITFLSMLSPIGRIVYCSIEIIDFEV